MTIERSRDLKYQWKRREKDEKFFKKFCYSDNDDDYENERSPTRGSGDHRSSILEANVNSKESTKVDSN